MGFRDDRSCGKERSLTESDLITCHHDGSANMKMLKEGRNRRKLCGGLKMMKKASSSALRSASACLENPARRASERDEAMAVQWVRVPKQAPEIRPSSEQPLHLELHRPIALDLLAEPLALTRWETDLAADHVDAGQLGFGPHGRERLDVLCGDGDGPMVEVENHVAEVHTDLPVRVCEVCEECEVCIQEIVHVQIGCIQGGARDVELRDVGPEHEVDDENDEPSDDNDDTEQGTTDSYEPRREFCLPGLGSP